VGTSKDHGGDARTVSLSKPLSARLSVWYMCKKLLFVMFTWFREKGNLSNVCSADCYSIHQFRPYGKTKGYFKFPNSDAPSRNIIKKNVDKHSLPKVKAEPAVINCLLQSKKTADE
jgi:hypothetical protein